MQFPPSFSMPSPHPEVTPPASPEIETLFTPLLSPEQVIVQKEVRERLSKDFYWYSPVLEPLLKDKICDLAVIPKNLEELKAVVATAYEHDIPITLRGGGTGNYGQAVPLYGGLVIDLSAFDRILEIDPQGYVIAEPGARLGAIEPAVRLQGWELRCYPSTWVKSTLGGFLGGGSGGIGSISHGFLRENETIRRIEILTVEAKPRLLSFTGAALFPILRNYGSNGIMTKIELALAPRVDWGQIAATFPSFAACFDFAEDFSRNHPCRKRLVTCFEPPIPSYFTPLKKFLPGDQAALFLEVETEALGEVIGSLEAAGGTVVFRQAYSPVRSGPLLSDYTWNHTTLWAMKSDPDLTYCQCGFNADTVRDQMAELREKFGQEILFHIEFVKSGGRIVPGSIPLIRFTSEERLNEIMSFCESIGVSVSNPHTYLVDCGAAASEDDPKILAKREYDPKSLLNPGKIKGYPLPVSRG